MRKHLSVSNIIAMLALFAVLGGTAYAAKKIITKPGQIKNGVVTNSKIKKGTIKPNRLSAKAKATLKGEQGEQGEQGPQGPSGLSQVVTRAETVQVDPGSTNDGTASCEPGETFLGGAADAPGMELDFSFPSPDGINQSTDGQTSTEWYGQATQIGGDASKTLYVWAFCAQGPS